MRNTRLTTGIALLVFGGLASAAGGQAIDASVHVIGASARFAPARGNGGARHKLKLKLTVGPRHLPELHDAERHVLQVVVDGTDLCSAAAAADGYRVSKRGKWRFRGEVAGGRVRITANGRSGSIKVKVSRATLPGLAASPAVDLPLSLEVAGTVIETAASFRVLDGRVRRWRGLLPKFPDPNPGPVPDPDPDPDPDPGPGPPIPPIPKEALLADLQQRGVQFFVTGTATPGGGFNATTLRCPNGVLAEVVVLASPPPGSVDMFTDIAYVCRTDQKYWAHRAGGFAGANLWVGPFALP